MATPIVIGAGPAGMRIARRLARYGSVLVLDGDAQSPEATEARPQLLTHLQPCHFQQHNAGIPSPPLAPGIRILSGRKVVHIDRKNHQVTDDSGQAHVYSQLFLALGASPAHPKLSGSRLDGVQTLYTRHQLETLRESLKHKNRLLIVGGGLLAVELAALVARRVSVTLIARSQLLGRYLDPEMSEKVTQRLQRLGVRVMEQATPQRLLGSDRVTAVELTNGHQLATQQVVLACGTIPDTALAQSAGLEVDDGILVDSGMRSSNDTDIFAVGDCAQPPWPIMRGNITQVLHLADLALATARNEPVPVISAGQYQECRLDNDYRLIIATSHQPPVPTTVNSYHYRCASRGVTVTLQQHRIVAFQALLPDILARRLMELWQNQIELSRWERVSLRQLTWLPPRRQPDPLICHCASVRLSSIRAAINEHGNDPALICQATQAGYYCGSCLDDIAALCGNNSWLGRAARWSTLLALLFIVALVGLLPVWPVPDSALHSEFTAYRLLTDSNIRELSGYLLTAVILMTLTIRGNRRRYWWHILLGSIALMLLPLHSLGGLVSGAGLNASLVGLMLLTALSGVLLKVRRRLTGLRLGHLGATLVLLAATLIHIVFIYQY